MQHEQHYTNADKILENKKHSTYRNHSRLFLFFSGFSFVFTGRRGEKITLAQHWLRDGHLHHTLSSQPQGSAYSLEGVQQWTQRTLPFALKCIEKQEMIKLQSRPRHNYRPRGLSNYTGGTISIDWLKLSASTFVLVYSLIHIQWHKAENNSQQKWLSHTLLWLFN